MSHEPPCLGTAVGDVSVADAAWKELWVCSVGLSSGRVFPQPSRQKAPVTQQEPHFRTSGTAPPSAELPAPNKGWLFPWVLPRTLPLETGLDTLKRGVSTSF